MTQAELIAAIDALPVEERLRIADHVYETVGGPNPEIEAAWDEECQRRMRAVEAGEMKLIPAEEVFRRLRLP